MDGDAGGSQGLGLYREEEGGCGLSSSHVSFGQIILALGNYMNSSKRGAVYGFKLQSLDLVRWGLGPQGARRLEGQWPRSQGVQPSCLAPCLPIPATGHQVH